MRPFVESHFRNGSYVSAGESPDQIEDVDAVLTPTLLLPYLDFGRFRSLSVSSAVAGERRRGGAPERQRAPEAPGTSDNTTTESADHAYPLRRYHVHVPAYLPASPLTPSREPIPCWGRRPLYRPITLEEAPAARLRFCISPFWVSDPLRPGTLASVRQPAVDLGRFGAAAAH